MKCDTSVTGKIGLFGSTFGHLIYQNLDYEACMLDTWSQGMCQNSSYYQQNDWWEKTVFFCLPNHVFQLAHFIGEIATNTQTHKHKNTKTQKHANTQQHKHKH